MLCKRVVRFRIEGIISKVLSLTFFEFCVCESRAREVSLLYILCYVLRVSGLSFLKRYASENISSTPCNFFLDFLFRYQVQWGLSKFRVRLDLFVCQ